MSARRLVVVTMSATFPPRRGNQIRTASLLGALGPGWAVHSYSLTIQRTDLPFPRRDHRVSDRWVDHRTRDPLATAWTIAFAQLGKPPVYVEKLLGVWPHGPLVRALAKADAVLVSPPYQFAWVRRHTPANVPIVFDEHSIETDLYPGTSRLTRTIARHVERSERHAIRDADLVFVTSDDDGARVREWGARRVALVPNGVDLSRFTPPSPDGKPALRKKLGLPLDKPIAVFVGSGHPPNVEAVRSLEIEAAAFRRAGIDVVVVGRCGLGRSPVPGITFAGEVADVALYLEASDVALCPLRTGSGTSLKVIEYLATGLPLVSTDVGVRGLGLRDGVEYMEATPGQMPERVSSLLADPVSMERLSKAGVNAAGQFGWDEIGRTAARELDALVGARASGPSAEETRR